MLSIGLGLNISQGRSGKRMEYFFRPTGSTYGTSDGKSYENAWDQLTASEWSLLSAQGAILWVCETHTEALLIGASGTKNNPITIAFNYNGHFGTIDGQDLLDICIDTNGKNYINVVGDISNETLINAVTSCSYIGGTSTGLEYYAIWASNSGNQAFQNTGSISVLYDHCKGTDCVDDGLSGHDYSNIVCRYCNFDRNDQGANIIAGVNLNLIGCTFEDNVSYDVYLINSVADSNHPTCNASNCTFNNLFDVNDKSVAVAEDCIFNGQLRAYHSTNAVSLTVRRSIIAHAYFLTNATVNCSNCLIKEWDNNIGGNVTLEKCRVMDDRDVVGSLTFHWTRFSGGADHMLDVQSGASVYGYYSIFDDIPSGKYAGAERSGGILELANCQFIGAANIGNGVVAFDSMTIENCIFTLLSIGLLRSTGTVVANNCCFFNNTTNISGTVIQNDCVFTDPKLNTDFSPGSGSSCLGSGKTLTESEGIASADWGNGIDEIPEVTTGNQPVNWNMGAFV